MSYESKSKSCLFDAVYIHYLDREPNRGHNNFPSRLGKIHLLNFDINLIIDKWKKIFFNQLK